MAKYIQSLFIVLCAGFTVAHCVSYKDKHYSYIQNVINQLPQGAAPPFVVQPPQLWFEPSSTNTTIPPDPYHYLRPTIFLWDPISQRTLHNGIVNCPQCASADIILRTTHWKDGRNARNAPRVLFSQTGTTYLVSRIYRCRNGHEIVAHDDCILNLFSCKEQLPFLLSHVAGITRDLYRTCALYSESGLKIEQIECLVSQQHLEFFEERRNVFHEALKHFCEIHKRDPEDIPPFPLEMPDELKGPSNDFICQCIIHCYQENEVLYRQSMAENSASSWISLDHTFKVAANIGLLRHSDKKWEKQYDSMFCILNEAGVVLSWQLTKGTAFDNVEDLLINLKERLKGQKKDIKLCMIDNCCAWRGKLQSVFGSEMLVKLDLFHAVQRIVRKIPKRHPFSYRCSQAFRLTMRDKSDCGEQRTLPTPSPTNIIENINTFLKTWKHISFENQPVLPAGALKEIENLKKHVLAGCLSYIPVGCGSERNENLHKCIRLAASKGRIGVLLAVALITSFLYKWNEKQKAKINGRKTKVYRPIISRKNELFTNAKSLTKEQFGIGVSKKRTNNYCSQTNVLAAPYDICCSSLSEMQDMMGRALDDESSEIDCTEESDDYTCTKIEKEAFTRALNLYAIVSNLPIVINKAVNTNHFHLMSTHALFSFGAISSELTSSLDNNEKLNELLKSYKFKIVQVSPDGDCLFSSVIFQLNQVVVSPNSTDLKRHLEALGFQNILQMDTKIAIAHLRYLMVSEMIENRHNYEGYITNTNTLVEYEKQVESFKQLGVYSGEIGNAMALAIANVLRINIVLFTSMENFPVIPVTPLCDICTTHTLYLSFNHFGSGHYDPVVEVNNTNIDETDKNQIVLKEEKGCGCGRGAAKKKKESLKSQKDESPDSKKFCFQEPGARRTLCPCYRAFKACTVACKCLHCNNTIGKRPDVDLEHKKGQTRRRSQHELQTATSNSLAFMQIKKESLVEPKWTTLEHILIEVIVDLLIERLGEATDEKVCEVYKNIVSTAQAAEEMNVPISHHPVSAIKNKLAKNTQQAELFRQFYLKQVENNLQL